MADVSAGAGAAEHTMHGMDPKDASGAYPRPVGQFPKVDGEQLKREFQQRQAQRRKEIRAKLKRINDARKAGKPIDPKDLGPLY